LSHHAQYLAGKIVIDCSNPSTKEFDEACAQLGVPASGSVAANLQACLPQSTVVKAFNEYGTASYKEFR